MQTQIAPQYRADPLVGEAESILRDCVHCGFCNATCPTYRILGDEQDGPRGRIYLIKALLAGEQTTETTRLHLDRCLGCRACETTCPSGVRYGRLLEIGRHLQNQALPRPPRAALERRLLRYVVTEPKRFRAALGLGRVIKPLLKASLARTLPPFPAKSPDPARSEVAVASSAGRRVLHLDGCVQSVATPATRAALARIIKRLGVDLRSAPTATCCGALSLHLDAWDEARALMRRNIDAWWPYLEDGVEAILVSASGCGSVVKDYGHYLEDDPSYAAKAARVAEIACDPSQWLARELGAQSIPGIARERIAFHAPCSLQHGQRLAGVVEGILTRLGYQLSEIGDAELCCGSAGSYSLLQPQLAAQLRRNKLDKLEKNEPERIATANVGCQLYLAQEARVPVVHWLELVDEALVDVGTP
ncbi:glycolate oxidase subunit GlcF [Acidithiobacillus caldus]